MRVIRHILLSAVIVSFLTGLPVFADEEEVREKRKDYKRPRPDTVTQTSVSKAKDRFKMRFSIGALEGYDNNVFLDSQRKGDLYDQTLSTMDFKYKINNDLAIKAEYDFTSITYHEYTDLSMMDNDLALLLEYYPSRDMRIRAGYDVDFITYFKNEDGDFYTQGPVADIKYYISNKSFLGAGYSYEFYDYDKRRIRDGNNITLDSTREDHRHNIMAEFGTYMGKLFFKLRNTFYFNDSNEEYMDFYDYWSEKVSAYITYPLTKKMYIMLRGGYQHKDYESRQITTSSSKEHDDLMILGAGMYYELMPNLYISANYTYRQNYSNDPIQEYSGSTTSAGFSYFF